MTECIADEREPTQHNESAGDRTSDSDENARDQREPQELVVGEWLKKHVVIEPTHAYNSNECRELAECFGDLFSQLENELLIVGGTIEIMS